MEWISSEIVPAIRFLLPGFVAAWIFYGLTSHPRRDHFERVIQALIFTAISEFATSGIKYLLLRAPSEWVIGEWTPGVAMGWSLAAPSSSG
jgi:hypothetical protein